MPKRKKQTMRKITKRKKIIFFLNKKKNIEACIYTYYTNIYNLYF